MTPLQILQLAIEYGPTVKAIWDAGATNADVVAKIKAMSAPLAGLLEQVGAEFFPQAAPALHIIGGIVASFDPNTTKWLQGALNKLLDPSPGLAVDGQYGAKTKAAIEQLQTKLGLKVDGIAGQITQAAIAAALAKLG